MKDNANLEPQAELQVELVKEPPVVPQDEQPKEKIKLAGSKWAKWRLVHDVEALADCQPLTCPYTVEYMQEFLKRFDTVFLKPDEGYGGKDVIRVQKAGEGLQVLRGIEQHSFTDEQVFDAWLSELAGERTFLLQQGIDLVPYKGKPVDMRTILQQTKNGRWQVTGLFAKAAKKGMAVTNVKAGGEAFRVGKYLRGAGYRREERKRIRDEMVALSVAVAEVFDQSYSNNLYGLDIGLDRAGRLWLIEVNTRPSIMILQQIDRDMFHNAARIRWPRRYQSRGASER